MGSPERKSELVKTHPLVKNGKTGGVNNPIRKNIAAFLERERKKRDLTHRQMWLIVRGDDEGFARPTYVYTVSGENNVTLRTLDIIADKLETSIADLFGVKNPTEQMKTYKAADLQKRLSEFVEQERVTRKMLRKEIIAKIEVSYMTYLKIMRGDGNLQVDTIAGIAKALRVDPVRYLFDENPE